MDMTNHQAKTKDVIKLLSIGDKVTDKIKFKDQMIKLTCKVIPCFPCKMFHL